MKNFDEIRIDDITPIDGREWPSEQAWKNFDVVYRPIVMKVSNPNDDEKPKVKVAP